MMTENQNYRLDRVLRTMGSVIAVVLALALFLWIADRVVRLLIGVVRLGASITRIVANPLSFVVRLLIRGIRILLPLLKRGQSV